MAKLILKHEEHQSEYEVTSELIIGRQTTCDVVVLADRASRLHAKVYKEGNSFYVEDLNSANGTFLNTDKIAKTALADGDEIHIGNATLQFTYGTPEAPANPRELEGKTIGNYRIHNLVGVGTAGAVYKAMQLSMERIVALKVLDKRLTNSASYVERFLAEARLAGKLSHPNLVRVHDFGEAEGMYFFSMEFVLGTSLEDFVSQEGKMSPTHALDVMSDVGFALEHAHAQNVLHRDLSPKSVIIERDGSTKLTGLGLARSDAVISANPYIAPESLESGRWSSEVDIYSLGATLYYLVTGTPFSPHGPIPDLHPALMDFIERCLSQNPTLRPTATELGELIKKLKEEIKKSPAKTTAKNNRRSAQAAPGRDTRANAPITNNNGRSAKAPATNIVPTDTRLKAPPKSSGVTSILTLIGVLAAAVGGYFGVNYLRTQGVIGERPDITTDSQFNEGTPVSNNNSDTPAPTTFTGINTNNIASAAAAAKEQEAQEILNQIKKDIVENPIGKSYHSRKLYRFILDYPYSKCINEARELYVELAGGTVPPEIAEPLGITIVTNTDADTGNANDGADDLTDFGAPDTPTTPALPTETTDVNLDDLGHKIRGWTRAGNYRAAYTQMKALLKKDLDANTRLGVEELLRSFERKTNATLKSQYEHARKLSLEPNYVSAEKILRKIVRTDPFGKNRSLADALLNANSRATKKIYDKAKADAKKYFDRQNIERSLTVYRGAALRTAGTKWHRELSARGDATEHAIKMMSNLERAFREKTTPTKLRIQFEGYADMAVVTSVSAAGISIKQGQIETPIKWEGLVLSQLRSLLKILDDSKENNLGLAGLAYLLDREADTAILLSELGSYVPQNAPALAKVSEQLLRSISLSFAKFDDLDHIEIDGAWSVTDGALRHETDDMGSVRIPTFEYEANRLVMEFELVFLDNEGAFEFQLADRDGDVAWFVVGSTGFQTKATSGSTTDSSKGRWRLIANKRYRIKCNIENNQMNVVVDGVELTRLKSNAFERINGHVKMSAQGVRLMLDNINIIRRIK